MSNTERELKIATNLRNSFANNLKALAEPTLENTAEILALFVNFALLEIAKVRVELEDTKRALREFRANVNEVTGADY